MTSLDWSQPNHCLDCGREMVPASSKVDKRGKAVHASGGYCQKCYSRIRRNTYNNPYFVDWSKPVWCPGCKRKLKTSSSRNLEYKAITHYGRGMCKTCFKSCEGDPSTLTSRTGPKSCRGCGCMLEGTLRKDFCSRSCQNRKYRDLNPEIPLKSKATRRSRINENIFKITKRDLDRLVLRFHNSCAYCPRKFSEDVTLTWDHVIPLSRGGTHSIGNIVPSCMPCNNSKFTKTLTEWKRNGKHTFID